MRPGKVGRGFVLGAVVLLAWAGSVPAQQQLRPPNLVPQNRRTEAPTPCGWQTGLTPAAAAVADKLDRILNKLDEIDKRLGALESQTSCAAVADDPLLPELAGFTAFVNWLMGPTYSANPTW